MKRFLIACGLIFLSGLMFCDCSKAEITVRDYMSYEFLDTQGYSKDMLRLVEINKAKTFGEELPSQLPSNKFKRAYRKVMTYIDPAEDSGDFGMRQIHIRPTVYDY